MPDDSQKTILLVEDEAILAMDEKQTLEHYGFNVIIAPSGEKAIETVELNPGIDLILMDINLGRGMEGTDAARQILSSHDIPLIFLSSHTEREIVEKTEGITSYGYIVKNSGETVLIASIKMAFRLFEAKMQEREKEQALKHIEWMLSPEQRKKADTGNLLQPYGDLTALNTERLILDSVGADALHNIVSEFLDLLGTSAAVYEKNGDYAFGIFSSGWCRFMDSASYSLCRTEDNRQALSCGKWLCHESCWEKASLPSMKTGKPVDIECEGGIHLYAVPIRARGKIIGSMNMGYGDPPAEKEALGELAEKYKASLQELARLSEKYESRPPFIIELAKRRLKASALLIGEIVERKMAESEKDKIAGEWQATFDASNDAIWILDQDSRILRTNKTAERLFRKTEKDMLGKKCWTIVHNGEHPVPECPFIRSKKTLQREKIELQIGEKWFLVIVDPIMDTEKKFTGAVHLVSDITERMRAEKEIQESRENLFITLHSIGDAVAATDQKGLITRMNPAAEKLCGWSHSEARGKPLAHVMRLIHSETRKPVENPVEAVLRDGRTVEMGNSTTLISKDGKEYQISDSAAPIRNEAGELFGAVLVSRMYPKHTRCAENCRKVNSSTAESLKT